MQKPKKSVTWMPMQSRLNSLFRQNENVLSYQSRNVLV